MINKIGNLFFTIFFILPLGLISKFLYGIHFYINYYILAYQASLDMYKVKKWETIFNIESKKSTWEIVNGLLDDEECDTIQFQYFKPDSSNADVNINLTPDEFQELLDFTQELNKTIKIKK